VILGWCYWGLTDESLNRVRKPNVLRAYYSIGAHRYDILIQR